MPDNVANALEDAFCRAYTCAEAIEKFLARSLAPLNEPGTYALPGETKMTVAIDSDRQVAWCNDSDVPRNAFNIVRMKKFGRFINAYHLLVLDRGFEGEDMLR